MARNLTKAQLTDELVALRAHCDHLETKHEGLMADFMEVCAERNIIHGKLAALSAPAPAAVRPAPAPRTPRSLPPHFVAAREAAMRLGKCVRVVA